MNPYNAIMEFIWKQIEGTKDPNIVPFEDMPEGEEILESIMDYEIDYIISNFAPKDFRLGTLMAVHANYRLPKWKNLFAKDFEIGEDIYVYSRITGWTKKKYEYVAMKLFEECLIILSYVQRCWKYEEDRMMVRMEMSYNLRENNRKKSIALNLKNSNDSKNINKKNINKKKRKNNRKNK